MKVCLATIGSHGDVLPFLAAAAELQRRGHAVKLAAPAPFRESAERAGIAFRALGTTEEYDRVIDQADMWHPRRGLTLLLGHVAERTQEVFEWIAGERQGGADLVVASTMSFGARIAQDKLAVPVVTVHLAPLMVESRFAAPYLPGVPFMSRLPPGLRHRIGRGADHYLIDPATLPTLNAYRSTLGLAPIGRLREWWNSPLRVLLACPDWYVAPQPDWPIQLRQVDFPMADRFGDRDALTADLAAFLDAGDPPLVFTYGSAMRQAASFFRHAIDTCRLMGRRGVLVSPQDNQVPADRPAEIHHASYAPFGEMLPRCAALVHHGGIGTVAQALAAGIPQLVLPVAFDHFDEGERLQGLGVGDSLSSRRFVPRRTASRLRRLLSDPQVGAACAAVKSRIAGRDGVAALCDQIEKLDR